MAGELPATIDLPAPQTLIQCAFNFGEAQHLHDHSF
jgi:hypothetical protein